VSIPWPTKHHDAAFLSTIRDEEPHPEQVLLTHSHLGLEMAGKENVDSSRGCHLPGDKQIVKEAGWDLSDVEIL
jgi:hypothetical protein